MWDGKSSGGTLSLHSQGTGHSVQGFLLLESFGCRISHREGVVGLLRLPRKKQSEDVGPGFLILLLT